MKKSARTLVVLVLSFGLLAVFLRGAHLDVVWQEIRRADAWLIGISTVMTVVVMALRAVRWQYLLAPIGGAAFRPAFRTTMIGFAINSVLPARPGEVIRPFLLARHEGLRAPSTFATIVVERLLDSVTIVLMLASFVVFFDPGMAAADRTTYRLVRIGGMTVGAGTLLLLGLMFFAARDPKALGRWAYKLEHLLPGKLAHKLAELLHSFAEGLAIIRAPRRLFVALLLSVPVWIAIAIGVWTVVLGFHIDAVPFTGSFLLLALLAVGVSVPTPGGVGGFEAAVQIGLTKFYQVSNDTAVGAALAIHATSLVPTVVLGFLFLIQDGLKIAGMQKLASAAAHGDAQ
jgi:uncharacterized protein (TIRG00374 family)